MKPVGLDYNGRIIWQPSFTTFLSIPCELLISPALLAAAILSLPASAAVITSTSFENETVVAIQYVDTGDATTDHDLVNNAGEPVVDSTTNIIGELGYDASYRNTRGGPGLTEGDFAGVTDFTGAVTAYTDGTQGYQMSDTDGLMSLSFDDVNIAGMGTVRIEFDLFVADTGYETTAPAADSIRIFATVDGTETDILNTTGQDIDTDFANLLGVWSTQTLDVTGNTASLTVEFDSNSGAEAIYLDRVSFSTMTAIPEPSAALVLALGVAGIATRRRRS